MSLFKYSTDVYGQQEGPHLVTTEINEQFYRQDDCELRFVQNKRATVYNIRCSRNGLSPKHLLPKSP